MMMSFVFANSSSIEKVSLQLHWKDQFEFAGYYVAKEKGFYKDAGLDVTIKGFEHGYKKAQDEILKNNATFAIAGSDIIVDISHGKKFKLLASIFQSSPLVLLSTPKSDINSIEDFKNKRVMITPDVISSVTINAMLKKWDISINDLVHLKHSFNVQDLIDGKTDLYQSYISNEPYTLKQQGINPIIFDPKDYGFDFYSDILFTSSEFYEKNPDKVLAFREATLKGWQYAFEHIDESIEIMLQKYNNQNKSKDSLVYEANELKKLAYFEDIPLGDINTVKLQRIYDAYNLMNLTKSSFDINKHIVKTQNTKDEFLLSEKEKNYLANKKQITMCVDPYWEPYEKIDKSGNYKGVVADLLHLIEEKIDKKFTLIQTKSWDESVQKKKDGKCEILSFLNKTPNRLEYLNFTSVLYDEPEVILAKDDIAYINGFDGLKGKTIGIIKGYQLEEFIKKEYPQIKYVYVKNKEEALKKVASGEIYASVNALMGGAYLVRKYNLLNIKIAGETKRTNQYRIGVDKNEPILLSILDKALKSITDQEKEQIISKWISVKFEKHFDYSLLWQLGFGVLVILAFVLYRNKMLHQKQIELNKLNESLEEKIKEAVAKNIDNERLLLEQSKLASMGEMIGNIAHQWRQPLAVTNMAASIMKKKNKKGLLSKDDIDKKIDYIEQNLQYMSNTIEDFLNYFKPKKQKENFNISDNVKKALSLLYVSLENKQINITFENGVDVIAYGYADEFIQVILTIINNAVQALENQKDKKIRIKIHTKDEFVYVEIIDNGDGVPENIKEKIFEPYFTTKDEGIGLGLYIAKMIIERSMKGKLIMQNIDNGAKFTIILKRVEESER
jgi:signal transduction histidine kinase/ABC-type nitrate/sulfonate/bicarbonate transport system substrate-binding protein